MCRKHERFIPTNEACPYCEPEPRTLLDVAKEANPDLLPRVETLARTNPLLVDKPYSPMDELKRYADILGEPPKLATADTDLLQSAARAIERGQPLTSNEQRAMSEFMGLNPRACNVDVGLYGEPPGARALRDAVELGRLLWPKSMAKRVDTIHAPLGRCRKYRHGASEDLPHPQTATCVDWTPL